MCTKYQGLSILLFLIARMIELKSLLFYVLIDNVHIRIINFSRLMHLIRDTKVRIYNYHSILIKFL